MRMPSPEGQSDVHVACNAVARGRSRGKRKAAALGTMKVAVVLLLLCYGPPPVAEALKLSSIKDDRGHIGLGLLRAVEVVRGRYERAWALVSSLEPSAGDLDIALELLQVSTLAILNPTHILCCCTYPPPS